MSIYQYDHTYFNIHVLDWIKIIHFDILKKYNFELIELNENEYVYNLYLNILYNLFQHIINNKNDIILFSRKELNESLYIQIIHNAYIEHFYIWKHIGNNLSSNNIPEKTITGIVNNLTSKDKININEFNGKKILKSSKELSEEELDIYQEIYYSLFNILTEKLLTASFANLDISI